ncbi:MULTISPECIES: DUF6247 family protein [unclassified Frankia]|uniref:DUF6247 family protein n=1 Tax=unclassified Frankia TaxID=2632575 RepID=UPI002AD4B160|nr:MULTISPECIES: DUF6247 family protein [unclassified Frankia]
MIHVPDPAPCSTPSRSEADDPEDRQVFGAELRIALAGADDTLDLGPVVEVIDRWWGRAVLTVNPEIEAGAFADRLRIEAGDPTMFGAATPHPPRDPESPDGQIHDPLGHRRRATA